MKTIFDADGRLTIKPEDGTEAYALKKWFESWSADEGAILYVDYESKAHRVKQKFCEETTMDESCPNCGNPCLLITQNVEKRETIYTCDKEDRGCGYFWVKVEK